MNQPQQYVLLGHPVSHSISPQIHAAVYREFGLPHRYVAQDCPDERAVAEQVERLRRGEIAGANVTVPWKRVALSLADELDESAQRTQAANVLQRTEQGRIRAYNTDQGALTQLLKDGSVGKVSGAVVLGNGGASLAAAVAAQRAGSDVVAVSARRWKASETAWPDREQFDALGAQCLAWDSEQLQQAFAEANVIVQATSAGMKGVGNGEVVADVVPWARLQKGVFLYDVVYNPPSTPFLQKAAQFGHRAEGGLSMLIGQAALAISIWLGIEPNQALMQAAAEQSLFGSGGVAK